MLNLLLVFVSAASGHQSPQILPIAPSFEGAKEPQAAFLNDGRLIVTFGAKESLFVAIQVKNGSSFEAPVRVASTPGLMLGMRRGPRIAVGENAVVITACAGEKGAQNLMAYRSKDDGRTWGPAIQVNDKAASAREGLHGMCSTLKGDRFACDWLDDRSGKKELYFSESVDGGKTWSPNKLIYHSPDGSICECCHPSIISAGASDRFTAMWRNSLAGNRDMYTARVSPSGISQAWKVGEGAWKLTGCPMDGGAMSWHGDGHQVMVFRRGDNVYYSIDWNTEKLLGKGMQPWVASYGRTWAVWIEGRGRALWAAEIGREGGTRGLRKIVDAADDPMVTSWKGKAAVVWMGTNGPQAAFLSQ